MKRRSKVTLITTIIMLMVVVFAPYAMGLWVKYSFEQLIYFYNSQGNFQIRIKHYHRGWFSSDAVLSVVGLQNSMHQLSRLLKVSGNQLPDKLRFTIHQRIYHGPLLFHTNSTLPIRLDLAFSHGEIEASPEIANFIQPLHSADALILTDDYLTFAGDYQRHITSSGFRIDIPKAKTQITINGMNGNISLWPLQRDIKGKIVATQSEMLWQGMKIAIPQSVFRIDRSESQSGLWIGRSEVSVPEITLQNTVTNTIVLQGLEAQDNISEKSGLVSGTRLLGLEKLQFNDRLIGSLHLQLSVHRLNADAVSQLSDTYSQLFAAIDSEKTNQQLFTVVPALLTPSSNIKLDKLEITTPHGNLLLNAELGWPTQEKVLPQGLGEIIHQAEGNGELRIAVPLTNDLIHAIAAVSYTNHIIPPLRNKQNDRQAAIAEAERQNTVLVAFLMQDKQLPAESGRALLALQKNHDVPGYEAELKNLLSGKKITASVAQMLRAQNLQIQLASMSTEQKREKLEKTLQLQLAEWLREGFVVQMNDQYVATLTYDRGVIKASGRDISM